MLLSICGEGEGIELGDIQRMTSAANEIKDVNKMVLNSLCSSAGCRFQRRKESLACGGILRRSAKFASEFFPRDG